MNRLDLLAVVIDDVFAFFHGPALHLLLFLFALEPFGFFFAAFGQAKIFPAVFIFLQSRLVREAGLIQLSAQFVSLSVRCEVLGKLALISDDVDGFLRAVRRPAGD